MVANAKPHNCEGLLAAWQAKLDTVERDQQFYRYTFDWFERAVFEKKFPEGEEQTLRLYFYDIAESTPLPREREAELADRIKNGDMRARDEMIQANLRFVINEAKKYQNRGLPLSDLISAGNFGLITAADRFDGTKGCKFITYAVWWIRQSILQTLAEHVRIVRLPLNRVSLLKDIAKAARKLSQDRTSEPDVKEIDAESEGTAEEAIERIAAELEVPAKEILETIRSDRTVCSLDELKILVDETTAPPDADILRESALIQLETVLGLLEERESRVIRLYFGLDSNQALTLEEIGDMMNLTRERIRQIKNQALSKLRRRIFYQALKTLTT
ncbi:MAG: RNA polymerase sigma factor RpoD/SigA [Gemmatimonadetes bacterium]|nr:RNA polymerase sigma factor RpoD/SigA [Gemmatimonadota bacterium]